VDWPWKALVRLTEFDRINAHAYPGITDSKGTGGTVSAMRRHRRHFPAQLNRLAVERGRLSIQI
jgi:hypothetical protein